MEGVAAAAEGTAIVNSDVAVHATAAQHDLNPSVTSVVSNAPSDTAMPSV